MLTQVADGVLIRQSDLLQNNTVVVQGRSGVLVIDPGITGAEMVDLATDLQRMGQPIVAGFSTHPHWDHALWHPELGSAPRYGTAQCATRLQDLLSNPDWQSLVAEDLPPEIVEDTPLDLFGLITGLPAGTTSLPWDGPAVRIIELPAHAEGHAALLIEESRVLVAGDMLSDVLIPFPDLGAENPLADYLQGLQLLEFAMDGIDILIPGHGSVAEDDQMRSRLTQDRAYVQALSEGRISDDPRIGPHAAFGEGWLPSVAEFQLAHLAQRSQRGGTLD